MSNISEMDAYRKRRESVSKAETLQYGGGGGTSPPMDTVDAKIAASEARTDTKFAELRGDLGKFATADGVRNNVWGAALTILAIVLAVLAFAGDRFDAGVGAGGALAPYAADQRDRDDGQDEKLDEILRRLPEPTGNVATGT